MNEIATRCPVCEGKRLADLPPYNAHAMARCLDCTFTFTRQRNFPVEQYDAVYDQQGAYQEMLQVADRTARGEMGFRQLWWFKRKVLKWMDGLDTPRRLLDVGCGPGTFLMVARQRGWEVAGVEPAGPAAKKAMQSGLNVHHGVAEDYAAHHAGEFGVVSSFEVLEHVIDPLGMLRALHQLLVPGGTLMLSVPNLDDPYCLKQQIPSATPPVHINFFSRTSLRRGLEAAGFKVARFFTLPVPTSSVRNVHGKYGALLRMPLVGVRRLMGRGDGTTLLAMAHKREAVAPAVVAGDKVASPPAARLQP